MEPSRWSPSAPASAPPPSAVSAPVCWCRLSSASCETVWTVKEQLHLRCKNKYFSKSRASPSCCVWHFQLLSGIILTQESGDTSSPDSCNRSRLLKQAHWFGFHQFALITGCICGHQSSSAWVFHAVRSCGGLPAHRQLFPCCFLFHVNAHLLSLKSTLRVVLTSWSVCVCVYLCLCCWCPAAPGLAPLFGGRMGREFTEEGGLNGMRSDRPTQRPSLAWVWPPPAHPCCDVTPCCTFQTWDGDAFRSSLPSVTAELRDQPRFRGPPSLPPSFFKRKACPLRQSSRH